MRLTPQAIEIIRQTVRAELGDGAQVRVFGSRTDDTARGGDVDLHVLADVAVDNPVWTAALLSARLQRRLDGRAVDVRLLAPGMQRQPIDDVALNQGVLL
ncbi:MAG: hypothetical protein ACK4GB_00875 [Tepidimonas sp.]